MILYFDSYITDIPLKGRERNLLKEDIRRENSTYSKPKRIDVAKYVLASYALYPWSHVLIKYELDTNESTKEFDKYLKSLFPRITIIHNRSADQKEYKKSLRELEKLNDPWIFYSPNNDHPLVSSDTKIVSYIESLLKRAQKWKKKYEHVSIMYSHYSEFLNIPMKGTPEHLLNGRDTYILEDDAHARVYKTSSNDFSSVQIVHMDQMKLWFDSKSLGAKRVIRAEDALNIVTLDKQIIIVPKKELCAHFDGYEHMLGQPNEIQLDQIPPLFIPKGFFTNDIKIAYGFFDYRKGWLNINPCTEKYSFRDSKYGTDLKIPLSDIPLFWKSHIKKIDSNKNIDRVTEKQAISRNRDIKLNPWNISNQGLNYKTALFWLRFYKFKLNIYMRNYGGLIKKAL